MAQLNIGPRGLDMTTGDYVLAGVTLSSILSSSADTIRLQTPRGEILEYRGAFSFTPDGYPSGTITSLTQTNAGSLVYSLTGLSLSVATYLNADSQTVSQLVFGGADTIVGGPAKDIVSGFDGNDRISGGAGNDILHGGAGNDTISGDEGTDTAVYSGVRSSYTIDRSQGVVRVSGPIDGSDTLTFVERLAFANGTLALAPSDAAGKALRLYVAALDRAPDTSGLGFHVRRLDGDVSLKDVASGFTASPEFQQKYGALTSSAFVDLLYKNVLHRSADADGLAYHVARLDGATSREDVLIGFSESPENIANTAVLTDAGIWFV